MVYVLMYLAVMMVYTVLMSATIFLNYLSRVEGPLILDFSSEWCRDEHLIFCMLLVMISAPFWPAALSLSGVYYVWKWRGLDKD
jgi:hypothetical protein